jgi:hypothetical protein
MQTDYPCRIPRLKGKPFPLSFSFTKGSGCPAGEEEYARSNARCWQTATIGAFCEMPKNDKSSRILLLSCLVSGSGAGVLSLLNSRCLATTLIANRMIHDVQVFWNHPNCSCRASIFRSSNLWVKKSSQLDNRATFSACSRCPLDRKGDSPRRVRVSHRRLRSVTGC